MTGTGYVGALVVTLAVEAVAYGGGLPRLGAVRLWRAVAAGLAVNLVSHPVAWFALWPPARWALGPGAGFVLVEALVCVAEWAALAWWRPFDRPLLVALVLGANGASLAAGVLLA